MPSLEQVKEQLNRVNNASKFMARKEIKVLPDILWEDEVVENLVQGFYNNGTGILCATNKRLIFVDKGMMFGLKVEDFPYTSISSIQYETGLMMGTITIFASGNKAKIQNVDKTLAGTFAEFVRAKIESNNKSAEPQKEKVAEQSKTDDSMDKKIESLERLAKLKEQGILTDEEFQEEKRKILNN